MPRVQVEGPVSPSESRFFSVFEIGMTECLRGIKRRSAHSAQHAVYHLNKAWQLREVDSQMAAFRAITAEEEAATAVFLVLREKGYAGADRINFRDHLAKQALYPFVEEVLALLRPARDLVRPKLQIRRDDGKTRLDILYSLPGRDETFWSIPPLGIIAIPDTVQGLTPEEVIGLPQILTEFRCEIGKASSVGEVNREEMRAATINLAEILEARLSAKANAAGYKEIVRQLREQANLRNRLLYASSEGYPGGVRDIETVLRTRKARTFRLLYLYCLLFPHNEPSILTQQSLSAFLVVLGSLKNEQTEVGGTSFKSVAVAGSEEQENGHPADQE